MKTKKLIICFVIVTMLCTGGAVVWAASSGDGLVTEPYEYPVVPGTDEWRTFRSHAQMVAACQIPEELLDRMTMEALLESVAAYPLLGDILLCGDEIGVAVAKQQFNGLIELYSREEAAEALAEFRNREDAAYKSSKYASPIDRCLWLIEMDMRGAMENNKPGLAM